MQTNTPFWRAVQLSGASLQPELIDRQQDLEHYQAHDVPLDTQRMSGADQVDDRALGASDQFKLAVEAARRSWISNSSSRRFWEREAPKRADDGSNWTCSEGELMA